MGAKPQRIRFHKICGFITIYVRIRYLELFNYGLCDTTCDSIKYFISEKRGLTDSINHNF